MGQAKTHQHSHPDHIFISRFDPGNTNTLISRNLCVPEGGLVYSKNQMTEMHLGLTHLFC